MEELQEKLKVQTDKYNREAKEHSKEYELKSKEIDEEINNSLDELSEIGKNHEFDSTV
ncbi:MAG: hypothetical protein ACQEWW_23065 [Bacillota bacterium]